jgi:hypothetical protein
MILIIYYAQGIVFMFDSIGIMSPSLGV